MPIVATEHYCGTHVGEREFERVACDDERGITTNLGQPRFADGEQHHIKTE